MMKDLNVLFIGGNWTDDGGRSSKYMTKLINSITNKLGYPIQAFNGGTLGELEGILSEYAKVSDVVFWFPNIPTNSGVKLNPKDFNHRIILVNYKRNDNHRYSYSDLISIALSVRADLTCEVFKNDMGKYEMRIFDILGTLWSDFTTNTGKSVAEILSRVSALKSLKYQRLVNVGKSIDSQNSNMDDIISTFIEFGHKLTEIEGTASSVKRHLGIMSFRGFVDPLNRKNDIIYSSERNVDLSDDLSIKNFVATKLLNGKVNYYGDIKPHLDTPIYDRLMSRLPDVNYIFHSHCYMTDAKFTERSLPTGCMQEADELLKVIESNQYKTDFAINMLGHGSVIFASTLEYAKSQFDELVKRELPEPIGTNFDMIQVDDGVQSFICELNGRPLENDELLEIKFNDGSISTYNCVIKYYKENNIVHKEAYVSIIIKGIPTELPITGLYARRI